MKYIYLFIFIYLHNIYVHIYLHKNKNIHSEEFTFLYSLLYIRSQYLFSPSLDFMLHHSCLCSRDTLSPQIYARKTIGIVGNIVSVPN